MRYPFITELRFSQIQNPLIQIFHRISKIVYCDTDVVNLFDRNHGVATPETFDYRQEIGKVVSSVSIADEEEENIAFSVWIIMPAVSRNECFSAQGNLERVQVFGELSAIDRMELIDSNRYGFVPGKIAFDDVVNDALWNEFKHPRHEEFEEPTRWSLLNAFTETAKKYSPARADQCYRSLTRLFGLDGNLAKLWK